MSSSPAKEQASLPSWSPYPMEATATAAVATEAVAGVTRASARSSAGSSAWTNASGGRAGRRGAADFGGAADRQAEGYKSRRRPRAGTPSQHDASACRQQPSSGVGRR